MKPLPPALRHLELHLTRRLDGLLPGHHLGLLPGPGTDHADTRAYQPGHDDTRHMDWAVTARTATPHIRVTTADHDLETWALADLTASMDFGTATHTKRDLALCVLAAIGHLTTRNGDRLGAHLHTGAPAPARIPARSGRTALRALLHTATTTHPEKPPARATLADAITTLAHQHKRPGFRVVISDFLSTHDNDHTDREWEEPLRHLTARHHTLAIEIIDPRELHLPALGPLHLTDPETGATAHLTITRTLSRAYNDAAAARRAHTRQALRRAGAAHLVLRTDRDWLADLARFARTHHRLTTPAARRTRP